MFIKHNYLSLVFKLNRLVTLNHARQMERTLVSCFNNLAMNHKEYYMSCLDLPSCCTLYWWNRYYFASRVKRILYSSGQTRCTFLTRISCWKLSMSTKSAILLPAKVEMSSMSYRLSKTIHNHYFDIRGELFKINRLFAVVMNAVAHERIAFIGFSILDW